MKDFIFADLLLSLFLFWFFLVTGVEVHGDMFLSISMIACRIWLISSWPSAYVDNPVSRA